MNIINLKEVKDNLQRHVSILASWNRSTSNQKGERQTLEYISNNLPKSLIQMAQHCGNHTNEDAFHANILSRQNWKQELEKPLVILGGHWDAAAAVAGICPGADDNGSSVAVALEVARLYAERGLVSQKYIIEFAFWCLEEAGYVGSELHARELKRIGQKIHGACVLESVGYFSDEPKSQQYPFSKTMLELYTRQRLPDVGNFYSVVGHKPHKSFLNEIQEAMEQMRTTKSIPLLLPDKIIDTVDMSDHRNFHENGFPSVMVNDTVFFRNDNYHQVTDTPDTLNYDRMTELVEVLLNWLSKFD